MDLSSRNGNLKIVEIDKGFRATTRNWHKERENMSFWTKEKTENQKLMFSTANYTSMYNVVKPKYNEGTFSVENDKYYL